MEVTNLLDIHTREELYAWYLENYDKVSDFWLRVNRAREPYPGVVGYVDAVEVALCFGWIDSTMKRIDEGKPIQHFTPRRKGCNWCRHNIERCRRLIDIGEMTPAGLAVLPDLDPANFIFEQWVIDALKTDPIVWHNFNSFPGVYRRIKVDRIQHYNSTKRPEYARDCRLMFTICAKQRLVPSVFCTRLINFSSLYLVPAISAGFFVISHTPGYSNPR